MFILKTILDLCVCMHSVPSCLDLHARHEIETHVHLHPMPLICEFLEKEIGNNLHVLHLKQIDSARDVHIAIQHRGMDEMYGVM